MLEYLLVRPADREGIFANHRCRFLVLDEVHTYRGHPGQQHRPAGAAAEGPPGPQARAGMESAMCRMRRPAARYPGAWCPWARRPRSRRWPRKGFPTRNASASGTRPCRSSSVRCRASNRTRSACSGRRNGRHHDPQRGGVSEEARQRGHRRAERLQRRGRPAGALPPGRAARRHDRWTRPSGVTGCCGT